MNDYEITLRTLTAVKNNIPTHSEDDHSRMAEDDRDTIRAIDKTIKIVMAEVEFQAEQEAHSEVTLELENGRN